MLFAGVLRKAMLTRLGSDSESVQKELEQTRHSAALHQGGDGDRTAQGGFTIFSRSDA